MIIPFEALKNKLEQLLVRFGMPAFKAAVCAQVFAANNRDGVHSHGASRFPLFVRYIREGWVKAEAEPVVLNTHGCIENWDGQLAPGMYTATLAMDRAIEIAKANGMGCVAVKNTNHWLRGGTYGWQAAEKNCIAICGTNSMANMPPYGGKDHTLGNNPLVIAIPKSDGHVVLDMAMSQFSYGKMNEYVLTKRELPVAGGYDAEGNLTRDPAAIILSRRALPMGFWKGSGLSIVVDLLVSGLSHGKSVEQVSKEGNEYGVSQFFLCLSPAHLDENMINGIITFAKSSTPVDGHTQIRYPGEQTLNHRRKSEREGVMVNDALWAEIMGL